MIGDILKTFMSGENIILTLTFYTVIIALYASFVFAFYRFLGKRDIIELNLNKYNTYQNPATMKFFAALFYIIEYLILLPIVTFMWFAVLAILTLVLSTDMSTATALIMSASLVAAVRITSFISEDLSKDLAKMLPFGLLSIALTTSVGLLGAASSLMGRVGEIPTLFFNIPYYLIFIVGVELTMRISTFIFSIIGLTKKVNAEKQIVEETSDTE